MARVTPAQNTRNVLLLTGIGQFSAHVFELMFPTLAVAIAVQTHVPLARVLEWGFLGYLLFGLGALPAGFLADRIDGRRLLLAALFALGVASLAVSEAPNGRVLALSLALMGACASVFRPVGASLLARQLGDARGRAPRWHGLLGSAGIVLTPAATAALCAHVGWQGTYRVLGYALCSVAVASAFLRIDARRAAATESEPLGAAAGRPSGALALALLGVAAVLAGVSYRGSMLIQPAYFADRVPDLGFGVATSLVYGLGIVGQYVGGMLAGRRDLRRLYFICHACSLPALLLMAALSGVPLLGAAGLFAFLSLGLQPIETGLLASLVPPSRRAAAFGMSVALPAGIGASAVWLVGWADGAGGLWLAVLSLAGVVALTVAAAGLLVRAGDRLGREVQPLAAATRGRRSVGAALASSGAIAAPDDVAP